MIGLVLGSAVGYAVMAFFSSSSKMQSHMDGRTDVIEVRNLVLSNFSCPNTVKGVPPACSNTADPYLDIIGKTGNVLIKKPDSGGNTVVSNQYYLRASCVSCPSCVGGKQLLIEFSRRFSQSEARKDALNHQSQEWKDLFDGIPVGCTIS
jgi:hypothetical protein